RFLDLPLAEGYAVAEGIGDRHLQPPIRLLQPRFHVAVIPGRQLGVEGSYPAHWHEDLGARRSISRMFGKMHQHAAARHLAIEREVLAETMFPIELEAQEAAVEFHRLVDGKDAEDRDCRLDRD